MIKESIYIETSVISYFASKPSKDIIALSHQAITREWWPGAMERFEPFISQIVIEEAALGDQEAARRRLEVIEDLPRLEINEKVYEVAARYMEKLEIPQKSLRDALHLAASSVHIIDYLVTWNCAHIANGEVIKKLTVLNRMLALHMPVICTPEALMGEV
jgi:predicted nucleic acid-binding protein